MAGETVQSVERALDILQCFAEDKSEWRLVELSNKIGLSPSTTHRILNTLLSRGYIEQDEKLERYRIGSQLFMMSGSILNNSNLRNVARPLLEKLSLQTEETVHLCVLNGYEVFYLDKLFGPQSVSIISRVGQTLPAYVSGVGKVLLANLSEDRLDDYIRHLIIKRFTPNTITDADSLVQHLAKVREQGYAIDNQELEIGLVCVAAPVFKLDGQVIASISVSGPAYRMEDKISRYVPIVKETASAISKLMGYRK